MTPFAQAAYTYLAALPVNGSPLAVIDVYRMNLPEGPTLPALVFTSDADHETVYNGPSGRALRALRMTLLGTDAVELDAIAEQLRLNIHGGAVWSGLSVQCHSFITSQPLKSPEPETGAYQLIQIPMVAEMWVTEDAS